MFKGLFTPATMTSWQLVCSGMTAVPMVRSVPPPKKKTCNVTKFYWAPCNTRQWIALSRKIYGLSIFYLVYSAIVQTAQVENEAFCLVLPCDCTEIAAQHSSTPSGVNVP